MLLVTGATEGRGCGSPICMQCRAKGSLCDAGSGPDEMGLVQVPNEEQSEHQVNLPPGIQREGPFQTIHSKPFIVCLDLHCLMELTGASFEESTAAEEGDNAR